MHTIFTIIYRTSQKKMKNKKKRRKSQLGEIEGEKQKMTNFSHLLYYFGRIHIQKKYNNWNFGKLMTFNSPPDFIQPFHLHIKHNCHIYFIIYKEILARLSTLIVARVYTLPAMNEKKSNA